MPDIIDTLSIRAGGVHAFQSLLLPNVPARPERLVPYGESYFRRLERLPWIAVKRGPTGERTIHDTALRLALLRFAPPYLIEERDGRELRYAIIGGALAAARGGWLALGYREEAGGLRLWVDVVAYRPRLGVGWLYRGTQVHVHRWITINFLHAWGRQLSQNKSE
jgi:hypothetical protein